MASLSRRSVIVSVAGIVCARCAESEESSLALEYEISDLQGADEVPDGVAEHPNPDGFRWVAVAVDVTEGEIPSRDLYGLTQIGIRDATAPARLVGADTRQIYIEIEINLLTPQYIRQIGVYDEVRDQYLPSSVLGEEASVVTGFVK